MKRILFVFVCFLLIITLVGCTEAEKVSYNVSKEADNFNVTRRVTVYNTRTDRLVLEVIGNLSVLHSSGDIDIVVEVAPGQYKKHFVGLNEWTTYAVEDISGAFVDRYHYEINYMPQSIIPFTVTQSD